MNNFKLPTKIGETTTVVRTSDSFVNVTELYKSYNEVHEKEKDLSNYFKSVESTDFIQAVVEELNEDEPEKEVTSKDIVKTSRGRNGATWMHPLVALDAVAYLEPRLKVKAYKALMGIKDRVPKRINLADRAKQLNSKICKLNSAYSDSLYESSKLIKSTHRKINNLAFGEHYDGIRDDKNTYEDLQRLDEAFNTIEQIVDSSSNIEEFVNKCKNI